MQPVDFTTWIESMVGKLPVENNKATWSNDSGQIELCDRPSDNTLRVTLIPFIEGLPHYIYDFGPKEPYDPLLYDQNKHILDEFCDLEEKASAIINQTAFPEGIIISIELDHCLAVLYTKLAEEQGMTLEEWIVVALEKYVKEHC